MMKNVDEELSDGSNRSRTDNLRIYDSRDREGVKSRRGQWIPVAAGILRKGPLVLLGQRPPTHSLPGLWEFPGGKIESGEDPAKALNRELREELGIECEVGPLRLAWTHSFGEVNILILFYEVIYWKGEPKTQHHSQLKWVEWDKVLDEEIPEANKKALPQLYNTLGIPWPKS